MNKIQIKKYIKKVCINSLEASRLARSLTNSDRVKIINLIIKNLRLNRQIIKKKNLIDIEAAKRNKLSNSLIDRLLINDNRISSMIDGLVKIKTIPDIIFKKINKSKQPSGIVVEQMRVPLGVIAMIYESRPNVTIDAA